MTDDTGAGAKNGQLRVWHIQNPPGNPTWYEVANPLEGIQKIEALAKEDFERTHIWGNVSGLCVLEDGEWIDWRDDEGDDIDEWTEKHGVTRDHDA